MFLLFLSRIKCSHTLITEVLFGEASKKPCLTKFKNFRIVLRVFFFTQTTTLMPISLTKNLGKSLHAMRNSQTVIVYMSLNGLAPDYLRSKFIDRNSVSTLTLLKAPRVNSLFPCPALIITLWNIASVIQGLFFAILCVQGWLQVTCDQAEF